MDGSRLPWVLMLVVGTGLGALVGGDLRVLGSVLVCEVGLLILVWKMRW